MTAYTVPFDHNGVDAVLGATPLAQLASGGEVPLSLIHISTELREASAPFVSRLCMGFAPGAKGSPFFRPSGVEPVFLP